MQALEEGAVSYHRGAHVDGCTDVCVKCRYGGFGPERKGGGTGKGPHHQTVPDLTPASIDDQYSVGPSIRPICIMCCLTYMIQVCSNLR